MRVTMKSILERLDQISFREDSCNCWECAEWRLAESNRAAILITIYPELPFLPRNFDPRFEYNGTSHPATATRSRTGAHREILRSLKALDTKNAERWKVKYKPFGYKRANLTYCADCGKLIKRLDTNAVNFAVPSATHEESHHLCITCRKRYRVCEHCGTAMFADFIYRVWESIEEYDLYNEGRTEKCTSVCGKCYNELYTPCGNCGWRAPKDSLMHITTGRRNRDGVIQDDLWTICPRCEQATRKTCFDCGGVTWQGAAYCDRDGRYFCPSCNEMRTPIHDYNYVPTKINFLTAEHEGYVSDKSLRYGIEIEIERYGSNINRQAMAVLVKERMGTNNIYIMHDGSIEDGIEITSHPFTWEKYKEDREKWEDLFLYVRYHGWSGSGSRCGFHVHMTKSAFKSFQLYKFLKFFYNKQNGDFLKFIAQRAPNRYSTYSTLDRKSLAKNAKEKKNRPDPEVRGHYNAINLMNPHTIEIRIFKGSLEPFYFHKNMEFLQALFEFTMIYPAKDMNHLKFIEYICGNKKRFPCLIDFVAYSGYKKFMS